MRSLPAQQIRRLAGARRALERPAQPQTQPRRVGHGGRDIEPQFKPGRRQVDSARRRNLPFRTGEHRALQDGRAPIEPDHNLHPAEPARPPRQCRRERAGVVRRPISTKECA